MLPTNPKQEKSKDTRLGAAVPYRAFKDRRLSKNDYAVLIAACGFTEKNTQAGQVPQQWIADQVGVYHTLIHRHINRLEAFGYLVRLAPKSKRDGLSILYGVVFDVDNPPRKPSRSERSLTSEDCVSECLLTSEKQHVVVPEVVKYPATRLVVCWRRIVFDYQPNELEQRHWQELATLGATPEHLAAWYQPGRNLIGYYMSQARSCLGAG